MVREFLKYVEENEIEFIHFEFSDLLGSSYRITAASSILNQEIFERGLNFNSHFGGRLKNFDESDLSILPDVESFYQDPFSGHRSVVVKCMIINQFSGELYLKDSRSISQRAENYLNNFKELNKATFGLGLEFFIFDDIRFISDPVNQYFYIESEEIGHNYNKILNNPNNGHRPKGSNAYLEVSPRDHLNDIRAEITNILKEVGIISLFHHHSNSPSQCKIILKPNELLRTCDIIQDFKYVVKNVVASFGKSATFLPQPILGENGSSLDISQSFCKDGGKLDKEDLSQIMIYYIGGLIKHSKALASFSNSTTNSYKRLVHNSQTQSILIIKDGELETIKINFPDCASNPYLSLSAILMAGLDGIKNKIHPEEAMNQISNYNLTLSKSLKESLIALQNDHEFLLKGEVFNKIILDSYIKAKMEEVEQIEAIPTPAEFNLYYSC